jgi:protein-L-isoaspartate(D-aspartate) O-methyltransferase
LHPGSIPGEASIRGSNVEAAVRRREAGWLMAVDFAEQREKMVDGQLRTTGVTAYKVLAAMSQVPREEFVPEELRPFAYSDRDLAVGGGDVRRFLIKPHVLARLIELARIGEDDVVLEIGCATGYSTAVLSCLAGSVIAVESDPALASAARANLSRLGYAAASVVEGPLAEGHAAEAPYDVILFNGSVEEVPEALFRQLREGGRLIAVVGAGNTGMATLWTLSDGTLSSYRAFNASIPLLPGFVRERSFAF